MKNSLLKLTALLSLSLALVGVSQALTLDATSADAYSSAPPPAWGQSNWLYGADLNGEFGSQAANYSITTNGGNQNTGFSWTITFDVHPTLTYAKLHSGGPNQHNYLVWDDAADFATFNASNDLTITFVQNYFKNNNNKYYGISGLGIEGTPGGGDDLGGGTGDGGHGSLPDSTATVTLLGLALLGLGLSQRKFRS